MDRADARGGCRRGFVPGSRPRMRAKPASRRATLTMGAAPHPRQGRSQTAPPPESRDWRAVGLSELQAERCVAWRSAVAPETIAPVLALCGLYSLIIGKMSGLRI